MDPNDSIIEPSPDALVTPDQGALDAVTAALAEVSAPAAESVAEPVAEVADEAPAAEGEPAPEPAADPAAPAEPPAAETPPAPADDRPSAEFGDLPADAKKETRERFDKLRTSYDTLHAEHQQATERVQKWEQTIVATGASVEQFGGALEYLTAVNSGTPEGLNQAYDLMLGELQTLAKVLGREVPGVVDPLADHPDIQKRLDDDLIDRETALELAASRAQQTLRRASEQVTTQRTAVDTERNTALDAVKAFSADKRATDPLFQQKYAAIEPLVRDVVAELPPAKWAGAIAKLYAGAQVAAPPAPDPVPTPTPTLRPTSAPGVGGLNKAPGSALEAVQMALGKTA